MNDENSTDADPNRLNSCFLHRGHQMLHGNEEYRFGVCVLGGLHGLGSSTRDLMVVEERQNAMNLDDVFRLVRSGQQNRRTEQVM